MRKKPNRDINEEQKEAAEEFISGAEKPEGSEETTLPWEKEKVRQDVKQTYPLRLPEPLHLKLKFLAEATGKSMNELCNAAVRNLVEEQLSSVLKERS